MNQRLHSEKVQIQLVILCHLLYRKDMKPGTVLAHSNVRTRLSIQQMTLNIHKQQYHIINYSLIIYINKHAIKSILP